MRGIIIREGNVVLKDGRGIPMRIKDHPILSFNLEPVIKFTFNGECLYGVMGDTVASALHAAGVWTLSHSPEKNRPRGLFCAIGNCSSCMMEVDGVSNVRVCVEPLREGMVVKTQIGKGDPYEAN
jgi:hypothetical protein